MRSKTTFPYIFAWFWEAFGSFWAPKVNILGSESDTENMSGFYAENEHPSGGTPPLPPLGALRLRADETHFP